MPAQGDESGRSAGRAASGTPRAGERPDIATFEQARPSLHGQGGHRLTSRLTDAADAIDTRAEIGAEARAERRRIARELHDGLIQSLYGLGLLIRTQAEREDLPARGRDRMRGWVERIDRLVTEATAYVAGLESPSDAIVDLGAGLDALAEVASAAGLDVSTEVSTSAEVRPEPAIQREILVVAREAVSNAIRHGRARHLAIRVEVDAADEVVTLTVDDDGVGFEPAAQHGTGHGLTNMAERAALVGGSLDIVSRPGAGTRVRLRTATAGDLVEQP